MNAPEKKPQANTANESTKRPGFLKGLIQRLDDSMKKKADEKSKQGGSCCGGKGGSCC